MRIVALCLLVLAQAASAGAQPTPSSGFPDGTGILIMAHGGTPEWNASVSEVVAPLRERVTTALAFGMADPVTMQAALDSLARQGVERVAVVRMFLSGASFRHQTEFLLGLRDDPPAEPLIMGHGGHGPHGDAEAALEPLVHDMEVHMSDAGLMESWVSSEIMAARAAELSSDPAGESVLLIAHGMGAEEDNQRVLDEMARSAEAIRELGFRDARALTLREDWDEVRVAAEAEIRTAVATWQDGGSRVLVLPFRLSGFGPYAEVLDGLEYQPGAGLLPHRLIGTWVERTASALLNTPGT